MNKRLLNCIIFFALAVGLFYFLFCMYFAAKRLEVDDWNERKSQFSTQLWVKDPVLKKIHDRMKEKAHTMSSEVTIITAYFNIGLLNKGGPFGVYTPEKYIRWMSVFSRIDNPVIIFTDSLEVKHIFQDLRKGFPRERTQVHIVARESLWAFQLAPEIKDVFSQPNYPNHDPNTVHENYSCVMHAKFELVNKVITEELFHTKYLAWMDVGLFRGVVDEKRYTFPLVVPRDFDIWKVAYSGQRAFNPALTPMQIVAGNKVWVGGAMFLARPEVLYIYTQDYMWAVRRLLDMGIMSTDQQVIYIMYLPSFNFKPRVEIQTYTTHGEDDWFYLGYMLKDAWDISLRSAEPAVRYLLSLMT
ncbi:protein HtrL-like [Babylonia areolata]|uniref:protein HtrL-like n=1 Tax=Babylonia areolata TaxID=304850 RepID=UPI003FD1AD54